MTITRALLLSSFFLLLASPADSQPIFLLKWGTHGSGDGQFSSPEDVAVDASGNVYVADDQNHRIQKFNSNGDFLLKWGTQGAADGQLDRPRGVALDEGGNVYVADASNHRIQKFTSDGGFLLKWGTQGIADGQFDFPRGIAVDGEGNVYVTELFNHRVQKFDGIGTFLTKWGSLGGGIEQFNIPTGVAVDDSGNVYVSESRNNRIQKFTSVGVFVQMWGTLGSGDGEFNAPQCVTIDGSNDVYVADGSNHRIQKFTSTGVFITKWGTQGSGDGQFEFPTGIVVDAGGTVYVTDLLNRRVQKFGMPPSITSIQDVLNDQGRRVRVNFLQSSLDSPSSSLPVLQYEVYRRVKTLPESGTVGWLMRPALADWEQVTSISAHGEAEYNVVVPTLADSTSDHGIYWSEYFIRAATSDPFTFIDSASDSGYSIDNLAPGVPGGFGVVALLSEGDVELSWSESEDIDFRYFTLYRGTEADFIPSGATLIAQLTETSYVDPEAPENGWPLYYKLSATDFAGNEGRFAETNSAIVDVDHLEYPGAFTLLPSTPNPVSKQVVIRFELPKSAVVDLRIHDVRGRIIRTGIDGAVMPPGHHEWAWDLRDNRGARVPSGMYLYSIATPQSSQTRKVLVLD